MAQSVKWLPNKDEDLSSIPSPDIKQKKKERKTGTRVHTYNPSTEEAWTRAPGVH